MLSEALAFIPKFEPILTEDDLPCEDGIPMEIPEHRTQMNLLIDLTDQHWHDREDYYVGGNMFVYFSETQARNRDYRGPDFFIVKDVDGTKRRKSWVVWQEDGRYPDLIIELLSESTAEFDKTTKKHLYERTFRTPEYYCYDILAKELIGWRMGEDGSYVEIKPDDRGRMWSNVLELWIGPWHGVIQNSDVDWLRFFDQEGNLIPTPKEAETERANAAEQKLSQAMAELEALRKQMPGS